MVQAGLREYGVEAPPSGALFRESGAASQREAGAVDEGSGTACPRFSEPPVAAAQAGVERRPASHPGEGSGSESLATAAALSRKPITRGGRERLELEQLVVGVVGQGGPRAAPNPDRPIIEPGALLE